MIKKILIALLMLVVVAGAGVYFLYANLDSLVKAAIVKYGTEATQAQVRVASVTLAPASGTGAISGLVIGNPQGFNTPSAFELGTISLQIDTSSITSNPVIIREIVIAAPKVTYERGSGTGNLETIRDNLQRYAGTGSGGGSGSGSTSTSGEERKVIIENLYVRDGEVTVAATALKGRTLRTGLPSIHLKDIGKDKGGATPAEIAQRVVGAMADEAARAGLANLNQSLRELGGAVQQQLQQGGSGLGDRLRSVIPGQGN